MQNTTSPDIDDDQRTTGVGVQRGVQPGAVRIDSDGVDPVVDGPRDGDGLGLAALGVDHGDVGDLITRAGQVDSGAIGADREAAGTHGDLLGGQGRTGLEINGDDAVLFTGCGVDIGAVGDGDRVRLCDSGHGGTDRQRYEVDDRHRIIAVVGGH